MRRRLTLVGASLLVLALVAVGVVVGLREYADHHRSTLQRALALAPGDSQRYSWTDWAGVRHALGADLTSRSSASALQAFLAKGFDADLTSTSALDASARVMLLDYGFSPATLDWELFSQADDGALVIMHVPSSTDFDDIGDRLAAVGYQRPADADGVWTGGEDLLSRIGGGEDLTPELQYLALDPSAGLILASDSGDYLSGVLDSGLGSDHPDRYVAEAVGASGEPLSAAIYSSDYTCTALAMLGADPEDQAQAAQLISRAGKVNPVLGFAMSVQADRGVRVAMAFDSHDQAVTNATSRAALARGPAPGQGGNFADRFSLGRVTATGDVVTMALRPVPGSYPLSDLSTGPLLFATC